MGWSRHEPARDSHTIRHFAWNVVVERTPGDTRIAGAIRRPVIQLQLGALATTSDEASNAGLDGNADQISEIFLQPK
jgi:hypothetical protein